MMRVMMSYVMKSALVSLMAIPLAAAAAKEKPSAGKAASDVKVDGAFIREVPPTAPNTAMFVRLVNSSAKDHALVAAKASISKTVELHDNVMENGVMSMRPVEKMEIKAKNSLELKPGSLHIMFLGLNAPVKADTKVPVTLVFEDSSTKEIEVPVRKMDMGPSPMGHGHMHGPGAGGGLKSK